MINTINDIDTPAFIVDERIVRTNIDALQKHCNTIGLKLRPHIKTHKSVRLSQLQLDAGATGINCQKIAEAEVMADAGFNDILITFNIIGRTKLARLKALHNKITKLIVVADNPTVISGLATTFLNADHPLNVMIECDTGAGRCGVQTHEDAIDLVNSVATHSGLKFAGLMTYPGAGDSESAARFMKNASGALHEIGIHEFDVSTGGTPDMWQSQTHDVFTEYRAGTYIYNDRSLLARGTCQEKDCAGVVLSTVVSMPTPERAIIDAGSKTLTSDLLGLNGYGHVVEHPDAQIIALSEEHGTLNIKPDSGMRVGDRIQIIPNHVCVVSNLFDSVWLRELSGVYVSLPIDARGCVW